MTRYILGRLAALLFVLFAVSMINFSIMHAVPGGPYDEEKQPLTGAAKENMLRKYGLDKPVWQQYLSYMQNAVRLDFGISYQQPTKTVIELIASHWPLTMQVGIMTLSIVFGLGIPLGIMAAYRQNSWLDSTLTFLSMLGITMPSFVMAFLLLFIFSIRLDWLPMRGWGDSACLLSGEDWKTGFFCTDWIMPVVAYALAPMAVIARYTRASVLDAIRSDFVRTARAKGLGEKVVMGRHVFRNALIPVVTVGGPMIPDLMTGSIFIESTFAINGLGRYFVTSAFNRDYPMIMAIAFLIAGLWGIMYLLTDIVYTWLDPRIRLGAEGGAIVAEASSELRANLQASAPVGMKVQKYRTLWQDARRRFLRNRLAVLGLVIVSCFLVLALFADIIAPYSFKEVDFTVKHPQFPFTHPKYWLGTDPTGRDFLSRLIYGARTSMSIGLIIQLVALTVGVPMGGLAGYLGGRFDFVVTRIIEIMTAFPGLLFSILIVSTFGSGYWMVVLALSITSWVGLARLVRAQVLSLREKEYVEAARSLGARQRDVVFRHIFPNILSPLLVAVTFGIPGAMFGEAGLSFLGIGINDPIASWGKMVGSSIAYYKVYWHLALFPTLAIALSMLGFSFVGDGLRDALDPKLIE